MNTHNNSTHITKPTEQAVYELIGYLGAMIDELQFKYCNSTTITPMDDKDAQEEGDGIPFDDDMPFV